MTTIRRIGRREWHGTLAPPGTHDVASRSDVVARIIAFTELEVRDHRMLSAGGVEQVLKHAPGTTLIVIESIASSAVSDAALSALALDSLAREDIHSVGHRAKLEQLDSRALIAIVPSFSWLASHDTPRAGTVSIVQGGRTVVVHADAVPFWVEQVIDRIVRGDGQVRRRDARYLVYALLDAAVDAASIVADRLRTEVDLMEDSIVEGRTDRGVLTDIQRLRSIAVVVTRDLAPLGDALTFESQSATAFGKVLRPFVLDLRDHLTMVTDSLVSRRDHAASLLNLHSAIVALETNRITRTLTVVATVFIPLTFVAGIYGMNFQNMPELAWRWGYPTALGTMALIALGMIWWFKRRRWF